MHMKLHDIATIIAGYTFRGAITPDKNGGLLVFQAKDLVRGAFITDVSTLTPIAFDPTGYAGYLKKDDVLVIARGMKTGAFRSTVFQSDASNVIASSSVHIIRITAPKVLPEYVSYYLNSKNGQDSLSEIVTGSYIGALPRRLLEQLKIPVPDLRKQSAIINLYHNMQMQQKILDRKNELKQQILDATFTNLTKHYD
ncbi:Methylase_S domain-containing protein [Candidatus Nitrotoga sp. HW29]|uniref:restriction endonuclease subunit S n=1 Tax=Candidatus Nitrotoga sp. HW29 TaxID=2886963 RepID=UPI001EF1960C|nr:restriction endonuclease subunit S [Candidatus Nitrotoga sp. HW29]CAH1903567.1 Methylase_S domain-containing protein [Candidatus Nitrotoga sp. HW29]